MNQLAFLLPPYLMTTMKTIKVVLLLAGAGVAGSEQVFVEALHNWLAEQVAVPQMQEAELIDLSVVSVQLTGIVAVAEQ